jgi:hypothetical protein
MRCFGTINSFSILLAAFISLGIAQDNLSAAPCPCDIYAAGGTPCVAAHSMVRALYSTYNGPLYQVRRTSDNQTKDIGVQTTGGYANSAVQDSFLNGKPGTFSIIYDQSPQHNDLPVAPKTAFMPGAGLEANAADGKITVGGHTVHGIYVTGDPNFISNKKPSVAYRNNKTKGIPTGNQPESMYMVFDGKRFSSNCCFDYGNAETSGAAGANATMEALYWGSSTWYSKGIGNGPWVGGDYENGMYYGDNKNGNSSNTSVTGMDFVTSMLKGYSGNRFGLKAGNAQSGKLETKWNGERPSGYATKKLEGAIILGTGGDGSQGGSGTFFEGCMTSGVPPDSTDDAVQANIVAAGYGSGISTIRYSDNNEVSAFPFKVRYNSSSADAVISYTLQDAGHVSMNIYDQRGRLIATIASGIAPAGRHAAVWNAKQTPAGVYVCRTTIDGMDVWTGKIIIGK